MAALDDRLSARISLLEDAVRENSATLEAVRADVAQVRADFERRDVERLGSLEARVTALEVRAGLRR